MTERRGVKRTSAGQLAEILLHDSEALHRCIIKNLTDTGARIVLPAEFGRRLPQNFEVTFDRGKTIRRCIVMWRDGREVGVEWKHRMRASVQI